MPVSRFPLYRTFTFDQLENSIPGLRSDDTFAAPQAHPAWVRVREIDEPVRVDDSVKPFAPGVYCFAFFESTGEVRHNRVEGTIPCASPS